MRKSEAKRRGFFVMRSTRSCRRYLCSSTAAAAAAVPAAVPLFGGDISALYARLAVQHRHPDGPWLKILAATKKELEHSKSKEGNARQLLDLASGPGEPGCTIAKAFPDISVTITDISEDQVNIASQNSSGLTNARCLVADAQNLSNFEDNSFDLVTSCYGYMFCEDLPRSISETHRVLKPGGCLIATYWLQLPIMPVTRAVMKAALGHTPPDPDINPLALSKPGYFPLALHREHFEDICTSTSEYPLEYGDTSDEAYIVGTIPVRHQLAGIQAEDAQKRARAAFWQAWERSDYCHRREDGMYLLTGNVFEMAVAHKKR